MVRVHHTRQQRVVDLSDEYLRELLLHYSFHIFLITMNGIIYLMKEAEYNRIPDSLLGYRKIVLVDLVPVLERTIDEVQCRC